VSGSATPLNAPDISVIIPCYNGSPWLAMQLEALAGQAFDGTWEVIVADNGSTDESVAIARSFSPRLPDLQVIDASEIRGCSFAYNAGAAAARGKVIAFCDADDVVAPGWLAAMAAALERHPVVAGRFEGELLNEAWTLSSREMPQQQGLQGLDSPPYLPHAGSGNFGISRAAWLRSGGFDTHMPVFGDTDLCWRLRGLGYGLHFEPNAVVHVRLRPSLRGIWRQAYSYGRALADLHERHGVRRQEQAKASSRGSRLHGLYRLLLMPFLARDKGDLAKLLWEYGWRVGELGQRDEIRRAAKAKARHAKLPAGEESVAPIDSR
jgi:glycosyltransferase involved in cell wall biosynthesis